jgi:hypothetical protein
VRTASRRGDVATCSAFEFGELRGVVQAQADVQTHQPQRRREQKRAEGVRPFSGDHVFELGSNQWPNPCDDLPVVFDRVHTDRIRIQWDRLPAHAECLKDQINSIFSQPGDRDVVWRLERLGRLRDTALITTDEFVIHKRRIPADGDVAQSGHMTKT